jgi:hypothetical protein
MPLPTIITFGNAHSDCCEFIHHSLNLRVASHTALKRWAGRHALEDAATMNLVLRPDCAFNGLIGFNTDCRCPGSAPRIPCDKKWRKYTWHETWDKTWTDNSKNVDFTHTTTWNRWTSLMAQTCVHTGTSQENVLGVADSVDSTRTTITVLQNDIDHVKIEYYLFSTFDPPGFPGRHGIFDIFLELPYFIGDLRDDLYTMLAGYNLASSQTPSRYSGVDDNGQLVLLNITDMPGTPPMAVFEPCQFHSGDSLHTSEWLAIAKKSRAVGYMGKNFCICSHPLSRALKKTFEQADLDRDGIQYSQVSCEDLDYVVDATPTQEIILNPDPAWIKYSKVTVNKGDCAGTTYPPISNGPNLPAPALTGSCQLGPKARLDWTHGGYKCGVRNFRVYRSLDGVNFAKIADLDPAVFFYEDSTLSAGAQASYFVTATAGANSIDVDESSASNTVALGTRNAVNNLTATGGSNPLAPQITLQWSVPGGSGCEINAWEIYRKQNSDPAFPATPLFVIGASSHTPGATETFVDNTITATVTYNYRLRSQSGGFLSAFSNVATDESPPVP